MRNSKNVTSWFIKEYDNGMFSVLFNTVDRRMYFHAYNDTMYIFGGDVDDEDIESRIQEVPEFLPSGKSFLQTVQQDKYQVVFYFIPMEMLGPGKRKIIHKSEDK